MARRDKSGLEVGGRNLEEADDAGAGIAPDTMTFIVQCIGSARPQIPANTSYFLVLELRVRNAFIANQNLLYSIQGTNGCCNELGWCAHSS